MKKTIFLLAILLSGLFTAFHVASADAEAHQSTKTKDIYIRDVTRPGGSGTQQTRSTGNTVDARYDSSMSLLEVSFNLEVGNVTIYVLNGMNQCIARYDCDTDMENIVWMTVDMPEGDNYTIRIVGDDYEGIGYLYLL